MADEPDLQPYTSGEWVLYLQQLLQSAGYSCPQDGSFDDTTLEALRSFQAAYGLGANDSVGSATWDALTGSASGGAETTSSDAGAGGAGTGGDGGGTITGEYDDGGTTGEYEDGGTTTGDYEYGDGGGGEGDGGQEGSGPGTGPVEPVGPGTYNIDAATLWPDCETVKIWFKAFIPGDAEGTLDGVGESSGVRLIGGLPVVGDCFYTDNRGFSADISASARMHSEVVVNVRTGEFDNELHFCGQTVEADCEDGSHGDCTDTATINGSFDNIAFGGNTISFSVSGVASDPCLPGLAPDVDYLGTYTIDVENHTVSFDGLVDGFPAFESYATVNHGAGTDVFTYGPRGNAFDLMGGASDSVSGTAQL